MGEQVNKSVNRRAESSAMKRKAVSAWKMQRGCADCGIVPEKPSMLELDHLDPSTKRWNVSDGISMDYGWDAIWHEVSLCEPVCRPCHQERTRARKALEAGTRAEKAQALGLEAPEASEDSLEAIMADLADLYWRLDSIIGGNDEV